MRIAQIREAEQASPTPIVGVGVFSTNEGLPGVGLMSAEHDRLQESRAARDPWRRWGPYLSERQGGTVREDYSEGGDAWNYFSHDQARSRAYRWGEDGIDCPTGSGRQRTLFQVAEEIARRLANIFLKDKDGRRPVHGGTRKFQEDPHWRDYLQFYEYFHGDNGAGLGANHQTGWTGVIARLMHLFATVKPEAILAGGKMAYFDTFAEQPTAAAPVTIQ